MVRMKQGRYAEARDALQRALATAPGGPKAHYQLSLAFARLGDAAASRHHRELYQASLEEAGESLQRLRTETGLGESKGGMSR